MIDNLKQKLTIFLIVFCSLTLLLTVKGKSGNPTVATMNDLSWTTNGPFELSPERGRFALTYAVIENNSVGFSIPVARFASPDLGYKDGRYVSLFAQGVSFLAIFGYQLGKLFGVSQLGAFLTSSAFAILNFVIIIKITEKLGASKLHSAIGALLFLFATPAFAYATTLYQHHISTFLILASLYSLIEFDDFKSLVAIFAFYGIGISVDYPNAFLMLPILIYSLGKLVSKRIKEDKTFFKLHIGRFITALAIIPPMLFFFWFNNLSYGSPLKLAGTVESVAVINEQGYPIFKSENQGLDEEKIEEHKKLEPLEKSSSVLSYFKTRNLRNGLYILLFSPDRGIIFFTPIVLFALFGITHIGKGFNKLTTLFLLLISFNVLLYSMWGDPWGGWAFGGRYLIPSYAIASIFIALGLDKIIKQKKWLVIFYLVVAYCVAVNSAAAVTSSSNPPKIEVQALSEVSGRIERYSVDRNFDYLTQNKSKTYLYTEVFSKYLSLWSYYIFISSGVFLIITSLIAYTVLDNDKRLINI